MYRLWFEGSLQIFHTLCQSNANVVPRVRFLLFSFRAGLGRLGAEQSHSSLLLQLQEVCCSLTATQ